jgi:hypothetical protein
MSSSRKKTPFQSASKAHALTRHGQVASATSATPAAGGEVQIPAPHPKAHGKSEVWNGRPAAFTPIDRRPPTTRWAVGEEEIDHRHRTRSRRLRAYPTAARTRVGDVCPGKRAARHESVRIHIGYAIRAGQSRGTINHPSNPLVVALPCAERQR